MTSCSSCVIGTSTIPSSTPTTTCTRTRTPSRSSCLPSTRASSSTSTTAIVSKLAVKDRISRAIPNPTFARVAPPGGQQDDPLNRRSIAGLDAFFDVEPRYKLMQEFGISRALMWPTLASVIEQAMPDDPRATHAVLHTLQRVDVRALDVRLRGRDLPHTGDRHGDPRSGDQGARMGGRARSQDRLHPARPGVRAVGAGARSHCRSSTPSGRPCRSWTWSSGCTNGEPALPGGHRRARRHPRGRRVLRPAVPGLGVPRTGDATLADERSHRIDGRARHAHSVPTPEGRDRRALQ